MKFFSYLIIVLILFSCESDPIQSTPNNGLEFEQYIFRLDNALENHQNNFQEIIRGESNLLFSGYIIDTLKDGTIIEETTEHFEAGTYNLFFQPPNHISAGLQVYKYSISINAFSICFVKNCILTLLCIISSILFSFFSTALYKSSSNINCS